MTKNKVKYPIAMQWKIAEAHLRELKNSIKGRLKSGIFNARGTDVNFHIRLYPSGSKPENREMALIYLFLGFKEKKNVEAEYTIAIDSADFFQFQSDVYEKTHGWGHKLCNAEELFDPRSRFFVNGEMVVDLEGFLIIEKDTTVSLNDIGGDTDPFFVTLWRQETKDFAILADDKEIKAHKIILSARSPVFQAMFQPHTKEAQDNQIIIPNFSFKTVEAAIKYCYHPSLVDDIEFQDVILLLKFFDKYDIESLKEKCEKFLISKVDETNVCVLYNGSIRSNAPKLHKICTEFLQECLHARKPVNDLDLLHVDEAIDLLKKAFYPIC